MIFVDGIGLGDDDPQINPFALANVPTLNELANGHRWLRDTGVQWSSRAVFLPTDAQMGVAGRPQSASGQAAILTGRSVPALIGEHYGPKPNPPIRALLTEGNLFQQVIGSGLSASLAEAYPPPWHTALHSGKMLPASYQFAAQTAGVRFRDVNDLRTGQALSGDWTGEGWHTQLGFSDVPLLTPTEAGYQLATIARDYAFTFMSHWLTDVIGHRGSLADGTRLLETFDGVLRGLLDAWDDSQGTILITSDHGNLEHIGDRHHTHNAVPTVIIGAGKEALAEGLAGLADIAPRLARHLRLRSP